MSSSADEEEKERDVVDADVARFSSIFSVSHQRTKRPRRRRRRRVK
jgi:hypothetical protein